MTTTDEEKQARQKYRNYQHGLYKQRCDDPRWNRILGIAPRIERGAMHGSNYDTQDPRLLKAAEGAIGLLGPLSYSDLEAWGSITVAELAVAYGMWGSMDRTTYMDKEEWPHLYMMRECGIDLPACSVGFPEVDG